MLAGALSRLPFDMRQEAESFVSSFGHTNDPFESCFSMTEDDDLIDCFANLPDSNGVPFALPHEKMKESQNEDTRPVASREKHLTSFVDKEVSPGISICRHGPDFGKPWKIRLAASPPTDSI